MALNTKQLILLGSGVATISGGTVGTYYFLQEKTIRDRLSKLGETLAQEDKDYEDVFKALKEEKELTDAISIEGKPITTGSQLNDATALKNWCKKTLEKNLSDEGADALIEKAKKYCTKAPLTIGEKINKSSKKLVSDWKERFKKVNTPSPEQKLLQDLKAIDSTIDNFTGEEKIGKAEVALERWCNNVQTKTLISDADGSIWKSVDTRCLENKG